MADVRTKGVIIKQNDYGEGHRIIHIFAEGMGIIKAVSYGAKKAKSRNAASSQFLCWGEFELYESGRELATLKSVNVTDGFIPLSEDIKKLALCAYMSDITYAMLGLNNPDDRLLKVFLNTLYALAYREEPILKIKSVYELKLMSIEGYAPETERCGVCGAPRLAAFDAAKGTVVCGSCAGRDCIEITESVYHALRFVVNAPDKKMLSFTGNDALYEKLGALSEKYLLVQADREFKSLSYFKNIIT